MKYFKMLDNPKNASKIHLSAPSKSVLELKTRISGKKGYLNHFGFAKNREMFQNV